MVFCFARPRSEQNLALGQIAAAFSNHGRATSTSAREQVGLTDCHAQRVNIEGFKAGISERPQRATSATNISAAVSPGLLRRLWRLASIKGFLMVARNTRNFFAKDQLFHIAQQRLHLVSNPSLHLHLCPLLATFWPSGWPGPGFFLPFRGHGRNAE